MGFFKKAFKKVSKLTGGLVGGGSDKPKDPAPVAAAVEAPAPVAAAQVEAPKEDTQTGEDGDSEAAKRAAKAKRSEEHTSELQSQ